MVKAEYSSLQYLYKCLDKINFNLQCCWTTPAVASADVSVFDLSWLVSYPLPLSLMIWRRSVLQVWRLKSVGRWLLNACCYPSFRLKKSRKRLCPNRSTSSIIRRKQKKGRTLKRRDDHIPRLVAWGRIRYGLPPRYDCDATSCCIMLEDFMAAVHTLARNVQKRARGRARSV
jgi:hypothetical protein